MEDLNKIQQELSSSALPFSRELWVSVSLPVFDYLQKSWTRWRSNLVSVSVNSPILGLLVLYLVEL